MATVTGALKMDELGFEVHKGPQFTSSKTFPNTVHEVLPRDYCWKYQLNIQSTFSPESQSADVKVNMG